MAQLVMQRFSGRTKEDASRLARDYWKRNQQQLGLTFDEYCRRCVPVGRGEVILFVSRDLAPAHP